MIRFWTVSIPNELVSFGAIQSEAISKLDGKQINGKSQLHIQWKMLHTWKAIHGVTKYTVITQNKQQDDKTPQLNRIVQNRYIVKIQ